MKNIILCVIGFCLSLSGYFISKQLEQRIKKLEKIYVLFSDISSRIEFTADSVTDIFNSLSFSENYSALPFVDRCKNQLQQGDDFVTAWTCSLDDGNTSGLKKDDIDVLISFGSSFGTTDVSGQISNCEIHKKLIESKIQSAQEDYKVYSKPAKGIGVLAGIALFIIFV